MGIKATTRLYNHFKHDDHNLEDHFKFQVLFVNIYNYKIRLETDFMYILNTIHPSGLNAQEKDYIDSFETYKFKL